jgi:NAD(P)-dependent dehydrogenase (short-subunit alcohol dehydrogenase family)
MDLDGAVALVTGGASGIGGATAARLRDGGARVAVLDLQAHEGEGDLAVKCDVGDEDDVVAAVQQVVDELGPPRVAVLAAGVGGMSPILQMSADEWDRVHRVNIRGVFLCLREAARAMVAAGQPGAIVATGSVSGIVSDRGIVNYSTSKAAVHQLVRVAAAELGHHGIRVNAIAPGYFETDINRDLLRSPLGQAIVARIPQQRPGRLGELDGPLLLLASDASSYMTGAVIPVDGGHLVSTL